MRRLRRHQLCIACKGTGSRRPGHSPAAEGREPDERATCTNCGTPNAACPHCHGRGHTACTDCQGQASLTCPECEGEGTVEHTARAGTGYLTTWTEGIIKRIPERDELSLPEKRPPLLVRLRAQDSGQWQKTAITHGGSLPDNLEKAHRTAIESRLSLRKGEIRRQVTIRRLPLARVLVNIVPNRVYYAFPGKTGIEIVPLPSQRHVTQVTAITLTIAAIILTAAMLIH